MTKDEALKLALEALELARNYVKDEDDWATDETVGIAIDKCKEALAQPVQEPMREALRQVLELTESMVLHCDAEFNQHDVNVIVAKGIEALVQPVQEPVAWQFLNGSSFRKRRPHDLSDLAPDGFPYWRPLYTTPPLPVQPVQERNFCSRCGKRTADLAAIHTCTPPQENT